MKVVDLFCGAGGLSAGLKQAGFQTIFANEINSTYASTFKINHPDVNVLTQDIRDVPDSFFYKILEDFSEVDLVAGGPPCQGFSINAPIRSLDDERNHLFKEFMRVVDIIRPKAVVIENVTGIVSLGRGTIVEQIYKNLQDMNYKVDHKILFAGHYGVPQMRFRTVFIAYRDFEGDIVFPSPKYNSVAVANFTGAKKLCMALDPLFASSLCDQVGVGSVFGDLPSVEDFKSGNTAYISAPMNNYQKYLREGSDNVASHFSPRISDINQERLKHIPIGGSWRDIPFHLLPDGLKRARRSDHTKRYGRLNPESLASTILTKCDPHWGSFFHPFEDRVISVREAARIQSFQDKYLFLGSMTEQYEQVGNAVPPILAREVGMVVKEALEGTKNV